MDRAQVLPNKAQRWVHEAIDEIASELPFATHEADSCGGRGARTARSSLGLWFYRVELHGEVGGRLWRTGWLRDPWEQFALAVLAGVAIASGLRARSSEAVGPAG